YEVILDTEKKLYANTEIMFIVDTTGSMGDEMLFLQSDFSAIAEEVGDENTLYSVNFYKDEGDSYVTKCFDFTNDIQEIKNLLCAETASGGGDEPEAVADILTETLCNDMWQEDSVKIAFLIYDAPPHDYETDISQIQQAISQASLQGIHLVPVVSSNSSRETELFGRAIAICTNSDYVFLTDDSGIGDSHLEPIIGDYQVEPLHDIIVRIIQDYKQS
ncbi:MAG: VWA domain-containing protein, partial [Oscillospiraceae bacterium]|nr:VWA domain-containing protein [Oscillospiraceae bacterium]